MELEVGDEEVEGVVFGLEGGVLGEECVVVGFWDKVVGAGGEQEEGNEGGRNDVAAKGNMAGEEDVGMVGHG